MNKKDMIMANGTITTMKDFAETVRQSMEVYYGEGYRVELHTILKNNDCHMTGIIIKDGRSNIAPTIYINALYEAYQNGMTLEKVCREVIHIYESNRVTESFDMGFVMDFAKVRSKICYKLVNAERNSEMLSDMPHIKVNDLALVFYILIDKDSNGTKTIAIRNNLQELWKVTTEALYEEASLNTPRLFPAEIVPMASMIRELFERELGDVAANEYFDMMPEDDNRVAMYVISNVDRVSGAVAVFYRDVLRDFANQIDSDLIILPSSIHEQILIPYDDSLNVSELSEMVQEINETQVQEEEQLSDNVYIYNRYKDRVELL